MKLKLLIISLIIIGCNGSPDPDPQTLYINFNSVYNLQPGEDASSCLIKAIDSLNSNDNYTDGYFTIDRPGTYIINEGLYESDKPYTLLIGEEY